MGVGGVMVVVEGLLGVKGVVVWVFGEVIVGVCGVLCEC